jgi:O-antigen/teichoic acid export membrane protein
VAPDRCIDGDFAKMLAKVRTFLFRDSHLNWSLADQAVVSGVNFLTGLMLARFLGMAEFGRYSLAWMIVLFANSIQIALILEPMMSIGPKQPVETRRAYYTALAIQQCVLSVVMAGLIAGGVWLAGIHMPGWKTAGLALPMACVVVAFQFQEFLRRYFFCIGRPRLAMVSDVLRYFGQVALLVALVAVATSLNGTDIRVTSATALWAIAAAGGIATVLSIPFFVRPLCEWHILRTAMGRHWQSSKWLLPSAIIYWFSGHFFIIAAGFFLGAAAVGAIRAAHNLIAITHILFQAWENIVPARAARLYHSQGAHALRGFLKRVAVNGGLATAAIIVAVNIRPGALLGMVFGAEYAEYGHLLVYYGLCYIFLFFSLPLKAGLRAVENTKLIFLGHLAVSIFTLATFHPLVTTFGLNGAMAGIVCTSVILVVVLYAGLRRILTRLEHAERVVADDDPEEAGDVGRAPSPPPAPSAAAARTVVERSGS